jgi:hypothetical protein
MVSSAAARLGLDTDETNPLLLRQMAKRKRQMHRRMIARARKVGGDLASPRVPSKRRVSADATLHLFPPLGERWLQPYDGPEPERKQLQFIYSERSSDSGQPEPAREQLQFIYSQRGSDAGLPALLHQSGQPHHRSQLHSGSYSAAPHEIAKHRATPGADGRDAAARRLRDAPISLLPCGAWPAKQDRLGHRGLFHQPELPPQPRRRLAVAAHERGALSPTKNRPQCTDLRENRQGTQVGRVRRPCPPVRRALAPGSDDRRFLWRRLPDEAFGVIAGFLSGLRDLGRLACTARRFSLKCIADRSCSDVGASSSSTAECWTIPEEGARRQLLVQPGYVRSWVRRSGCGTSWMRLLRDALTLLALESSALFEPHLATHDLRAGADEDGTATIMHSLYSPQEASLDNKSAGFQAPAEDGSAVFASASFGPPMRHGRHYVEATITQVGTHGVFIGVVPSDICNMRTATSQLPVCLAILIFHLQSALVPFMTQCL